MRNAPRRIRPNIKNASVSKCIPSSYRPVMNSCMILNIFEYSLLLVSQKNMKLSTRQCGFWSGKSCIDALVLIKETIDSYNIKNSFASFGLLVLSKAFDRLDKGVSIGRLLKTTVPMNIIRLLYYYDEKHAYNDLRESHSGEAPILERLPEGEQCKIGSLLYR